MVTWLLLVVVVLGVLASVGVIARELAPVRARRRATSPPIVLPQGVVPVPRSAAGGTTGGRPLGSLFREQSV